METMEYMKPIYETLTVENIDRIAAAILEVLRGKRYVFASHGPFPAEPIRVRVNQELKNGTNGSPLLVWRNETSAGFNFVDSYGVWGASTLQQEAGYDPKFAAPYVTIEYGTITITQLNDYGEVLLWTIAVIRDG